jgi:hypothetical protein
VACAFAAGHIAEAAIIARVACAFAAGHIAEA